MADDQLRDFVLDQLTVLRDVRCRAMFGGHGFYSGGKFFGVIFDGRLYFRTDEHSQTAYVERGMPAYQPPGRPRGPRTVDRNFEVPADVLEDPTLLVEWARAAIRAAG